VEGKLLRLIKEPVLQFLILGGGLFAAYAAFAPTENAPRNAITVTAPRIESLSDNFERTWRRPPTAEELQGLLEDYVAEEVLYREALLLGLDRDDLVVRRRMRQKVELLLTDALSAAPPGEAELRAHFAANRDRYREPARLTFRHIFLGAKESGKTGDWFALAEQLNGDPDFDLASAGAPSLLPPGMEMATALQIEGTFGPEFSAALAGLAPGQWHGPLESSYGWHLVRIDTAIGGKDLAFEDALGEVTRDVEYERERAARAELVERLKQKYDITIEDAPK
jgi:hypothetical protein